MRRLGHRLVGLVLLVASAAIAACSPAHSPQDSTETGNPPVIDAARVALGTRGADVLIIGRKGAISPGGVALHARNLASHARTSGHAARDGSFELKAPGGSADAYSLQAGSGSALTEPVFVLSGGAAIRGKGKDGALSCTQQDQLAEKQLAIIDFIGSACTRDDECVAVSRQTTCHDACPDAVVQKADVTLIHAIVATVDQGLCAGFADAGCQLMKLPCDAQHAIGRLVCVSGRCRGEPADAGASGDGGSDAGAAAGDAGALACTDRANMAITLLDQAIAAADKTCTQDADCVLAPSITACGADCAGLAVSIQGKPAVDAAIAMLDNGLCKSFQADGCSQPVASCSNPPTPFCTQNQCAGRVPP